MVKLRGVVALSERRTKESKVEDAGVSIMDVNPCLANPASRYKLPSTGCSGTRVFLLSTDIDQRPAILYQPRNTNSDATVKFHLRTGPAMTFR